MYPVCVWYPKCAHCPECACYPARMYAFNYRLSNRLNESYWRGSCVNRCNRLACAHVLQFVVFFLNLMNQFFFVALHRFLYRGPSPRFVGRPLIEIFFIFFSIMFRFPLVHAVSAVLLLVYRVYRCSIVVLSSVYRFLLSSVLSVVLFVRLVLIETLLSLDHLWARSVD